MAKDAKKAELEAVVIPSDLFEGIVPSEMGGWIPTGPITPSAPTIIGFKAKSKNGQLTPDVIVKFVINGTLCKSYASTMMGTFASDAKNVNQELFVDNGNGKTFRSDILIGYVKDETNERFPFKMEIMKG